MNTITKKIQASKHFEQLKGQLKTTQPSGRAESLADRIEEGAAGLAAFADGLSEEEWRTPVSESGRDDRSEIGRASCRERVGKAVIAAILKRTAEDESLSPTVC